MVEQSKKDDEKFVTEYRPLVISIARRVKRQFDLNCDEGDLIAFGFKGLLEARQRFDSGRGIQFNTFAYYRVRGAVIDGVREMAFLPRRAYAKLRAAEIADQVSEGVADAKAAEPAGTTKTPEAAAAAIDDTLAKLSAGFVLSALGQDEESAPPNAEERLVQAGEASRIREALSVLDEREKKLVMGFYFEGRRFDEVAAEMGISKSWASRIHTKALGRLKAALGDD